MYERTLFSVERTGEPTPKANAFCPSQEGIFRRAIHTGGGTPIFCKSRTYRFTFVLFVLVACFCQSLAASSQGIDVLKQFQAGNQFYSQGNFKEAIEQYLRITRTNFVNEIIYYNLGNAFFKDNQLGMAILYYEKARRLTPGNLEISENLNLARTRIVDKVESPQEGFLLRQLNRLLNFLPLDQETGLAVTLFVAANFSFTLFVLAKSERLRRIALYASAFLMILFLMVGASNVFRIYQSATIQEAIILADKADVLSGPSEDNPTLFSIHEGLKVKVQAELNQWAQISLENGWNGWVKTEALGTI